MLGLGRSSMRVMPSVASGRYSPGPGTETLLGDEIYQEIRPVVADCSPREPDSLATESRTEHLDPGLSGPRVAGAAIGRQRIIPAARSPVSRRFVLEEHAIDRKVVRLALQTSLLHPAVC